MTTGLATALAAAAWAHCDTTNGPVIRDATAGLEKGDITPILKWVRKDTEAEVRAAFAKARAVRTKGVEARELADRYFLETLVRLHRAGEGAPYTGIKDEPAEPIVAMADNALADGSADAIIHEIGGHMAAALREKFKQALDARKSQDRSVEAGREYVDAYVAYMHFVEALHAAITSAGDRHGAAPDAAPPAAVHEGHEN